MILGKFVNVEVVESTTKWSDWTFDAQTRTHSRENLETGVKEVRSCNSTLETTVTPATLIENGSIVKKCTVCDGTTTDVVYSPVVSLEQETVEYTGNVITPKVKVEDVNGKAIDTSCYTVSGVEGIQNVGTYNIVVRFDSELYTGEKTLEFSVITTQSTESSSEESSSSETESTEPSSEEPSSSESPEEPEEPVCVHTTVLKNYKEATYEEDGYTGDLVCIKCEEVVEYGEVIPKLTQPTESSTEPSSEEPSSSETEPTEPSSEEPSSTKATFCMHSMVLKNAKPATEFEDGYSGDFVCEKCGFVTLKGNVIPKLGVEKPTEPTTPVVCAHTTVVKGAAKASYFADGYTGDTTCVKCGVVTVKGSKIAKLTLKTPSFKLTKGKKQFKVKYTAVSGATGFQVKYKLKGKWKTKTYKTTKTVTKAIKKLKKGKYSVKVRAFATQGKLKVYSAWSKTKKVKV